MSVQTADHAPTRRTFAEWLPSALIWAIVFVSFRPFETGVVSGGQSQPSSGGDIVNQAGFGALGAICILLLAKSARPRPLSPFVNLSWWLAGLVLAFSVVQADYPPGAFRAVAFTLIVVFAAVTAMSLLRSLSSLTDALAFAVGTAIVFSYIAVFLVPAQGVHGGGGFEPEHAGLWRGIFDHKNVASYVMGAFVLISLFIMRSGRPVLGLVLALASILFVLQAGSKTVLAVLPVAAATAMIAGWITWGPLRLLAILVPVVTLNVVTLGAVLHPPILEWLRTIVPGLSYTGRTDLWIFGLQYLAEVPWTGYGYESFWATPRVAGLEQPIELSWDVRGIVHGHNSWLDAAIAFGIPGALLLSLALVVLPLRDYLVIPQRGNPHRLATLFIGLYVLTALGACLESYFLRRSDPVWFTMLMAIVGLRITAHRSARR